MRKHLFKVFSVVMVLALVLPVAAFGQTPPNQPRVAESAQATAAGGYRYIVQLSGPALLENNELAPMRGIDDINSAAAQDYIAELEARQADFVAQVQQAIPGAELAQYIAEDGIARDLTYQVAFNGLTLTLPDRSKETLLQLMNLPNVEFLFPEVEYQLDMDASLPLIGLGDPSTGEVYADGLWDLLGGVENAGTGVKVAVLDTGIDIDHDFFDPTGFSYPPGYPKGMTSYTTEKVIVSRGYYRAFDPPVYNDPLDHNGHGSHTSGTVAGNWQTVASVGTLSQTVSGVAPMAQLMNYQIFYVAQSGSESAWNPEILMALEDLVLDGADVTNNSWGGSEAQLPQADPIGLAFANIIDAGIVAVKSAGNEGRGAGSVDTLSGLEDMISVGASTTSRSFGNELVVTAPVTATIPVTLTSVLATESAVSPLITETVGPETYVYVGRVDSGNGEACDPIAADLTGLIALISRGSCNFTVKLLNAESAGAVAAVVYNNVPHAPPIVMGGDPPYPTIPSFMVGNDAGLEMVAWDALYPGQAELQIGTETARVANAKAADVIADFSGTGPNNSVGIGPHIVAPGVDILSAGADNSWMAIQGTSMAAPHVAGAAALLVQLHPEWSVAEVKSALMTKAETEGLYNDYPQTDMALAMDRGAGRLDLSDMGAVDFFIDTPALSFQTVAVTETKTMDIQVWAGMMADSYSVTVQELVTDTGVTVSANVSSVDVPTVSTGVVELTVETAGATPGDYEGWVWFENGDGEMYHVPYWLRVAPESDATVLLLDDDFSTLDALPDVQGFYTETLTTMGLSYDVWDVGLAWWFSTGDTGGLPPVDVLQEYDTIIWFTGLNSYSYANLGAMVDDRWAFLDYLNSSDAKVIVSGQDFSGYMLSGDTDAPNLPYVGFGADVEQEDAFAPYFYDSPHDSAQGVVTDPAFGGMVFDLAYNPPFTNTAELYVDELDPIAEFGGAGFIESLMPGAEAEGYIAVKRSYEPTLENMGEMTVQDYRSLYFAFGLESINSGVTNRTTGLTLMDTAFDWLHDEPMAMLEASNESFEFGPQEYVYFTATLTSTLSGVTAHSYRWDFGDGSDYVTSEDGTVVHLYEEPGDYVVRVEITDSLGHKALAERPADVGTVLYFPLIYKDYGPTVPSR